MAKKKCSHAGNQRQRKKNVLLHGKNKHIRVHFNKSTSSKTMAKNILINQLPRRQWQKKKCSHAGNQRQRKKNVLLHGKNKHIRVHFNKSTSSKTMAKNILINQLPRRQWQQKMFPCRESNPGRLGESQES